MSLKLLLWSKVPSYLNTLKLLSTLNLGVTTLVMNFLPSLDHKQAEAEEDLHFPTYFLVFISQISISPLRFPNPAKIKNLFKLEKKQEFL